MKLKILTLCLLFVAVLFSCKKEELFDVESSGNTTVPILSKVLVDNQPAFEYLFNASNLITEVKSKLDFTKHLYNDKGQLVSTEYYVNDDFLSSNVQIFQAAMNSNVWVTPENGVKGGTMTYQYNDKGQLIKTQYTRPLSTCSESSEFSYDVNNRISRQTMDWDNSPKGYIDYTYDAKGNLIKEMLYNLPESGVAELSTITSYTFDNEQNPFKSFSRLMIHGLFTNRNNIMKETYTIHLTPDQGPDKVQITENTYQYNALGYPVSKNGNVSYIYK